MAGTPETSRGQGYPLGLTGATAATRYVGGTASGAPVAGTFAIGDFVIDQTGKVYVCTAAGSPGTWTQAGGGGVNWTTVTKLADESVSSSTVVQNDDELFFATVSGAQYEIDIVLVYASPAGAGTPDMKCDFGEDATQRGGFGGFVISNTDTFVATASTVANQTATLVLGTAATNRIARLPGMYSANGGTFRVRWAQNTSDANATIMRAGSLIRYNRVV